RLLRRRLGDERCTLVTSVRRHSDSGVNESGKWCQQSTNLRLMPGRPRAAEPAPIATGPCTCLRPRCRRRSQHVLFAGKPSGFSGGRLEAELCTVVTTNGRHDDNGVNESGKRCQWSTKLHLMSVRPRAAGPAPAATGPCTDRKSVV